MCLFAYNGVQHIFCCVFALFFFVLLPVSLDCPFWIAPSVFSNVYLLYLFKVFTLCDPSSGDITEQFLKLTIN